MLLISTIKKVNKLFFVLRQLQEDLRKQNKKNVFGKPFFFFVKYN